MKANGKVVRLDSYRQRDVGPCVCANCGNKSEEFVSEDTVWPRWCGNCFDVAVYPQCYECGCPFLYDGTMPFTTRLTLLVTGESWTELDGCLCEVFDVHGD